MQHDFITDLLIILTTGFVAGYVCRQWSLPPLMGYLAAGVVLGEDILGLVPADQHQIRELAELGVFFLLFSIGLELSLEDLRRMGRFFLLGGSVQMLLVAIPISLVLLWRSWNPSSAVLIGCGLAFSSTVLVFKALGEIGQTSSPSGRRALSILLFQDTALIPLLLCIPILAGSGEAATWQTWILLAIITVSFVAGTVGLRHLFNRWVIPKITRHRSPDLVVLLTLTTLGLVTLVAYEVGLPPALGALAAGLAFGGNRWSEQIDSLILPLREVFAAIFFVSLGLLIDFSALLLEPVSVIAAIVTLVAIKAVAGTLAMWLSGLGLSSAWRAGIGLAHVGEFAFVIILLGSTAGVISDNAAGNLMTIAGGTLLIAPIAIRWGFRHHDPDEPDRPAAPREHVSSRLCVVIGMGPVGRAVASRLETLGFEVCVVDSNPLNLQDFAQQGFRTVAGDGANEPILESAGVPESNLIIVCVPIDEVAIRITELCRQMNRRAQIIVRCRYARNISVMRSIGADQVTSEEAETVRKLTALVEQLPAFPQSDSVAINSAAADGDTGVTLPP